MHDKYYLIEKELINAISQLNLNGTQWKIFWAVFINTYNNASKEMSRSFIAETTNCHPIQTSRELKKMLDRKILIEVIKPDYINARVLNINKNFNEWRLM